MSIWSAATEQNLRAKVHIHLKENDNSRVTVNNIREIRGSSSLASSLTSSLTSSLASSPASTSFADRSGGKESELGHSKLNCPMEQFQRVGERAGLEGPLVCMAWNYMELHGTVWRGERATRLACDRPAIGLRSSWDMRSHSATGHTMRLERIRHPIWKWRTLLRLSESSNFAKFKGSNFLEAALFTG